MIYNVLVVFYNNKYIFDFSDFLIPQTPGATYMIHMTNSLNYCIFFKLFFFCLFMTKSLLFYDQIIFFLMWCILRLSNVKIILHDVANCHGKTYPILKHPMHVKIIL